MLESYKGLMVDDLGQRADEGRAKQRYAGDRCTKPLTPGFPNGETQYRLCCITAISRGKPVN